MKAVISSFIANYSAGIAKYQNEIKYSESVCLFEREMNSFEVFLDKIRNCTIPPAKRSNKIPASVVSRCFLNLKNLIEFAEAASIKHSKVMFLSHFDRIKFIFCSHLSL